MEMGAAPIAERLHHGYKLFTLGIERVGDHRRQRLRGITLDHPILFQLAKLVGQDLFRNIESLLRSSAKRMGPNERCHKICTFHLPESTLMVACTGHP